MHSHCLACHKPFPANDVLERFSVGRRVAYDPARGRLWAVCPSCARWTLAPIEERWEALEDLERLTRDRAKLLGETDNIALLRSGPLEIVRVGRAGLREESWWRYGEEFSARQSSVRRILRVGTLVDALFMLVVAGIPFPFGDQGRWVDRARARRFGRTAWSGSWSCVRCGDPLRAVRFDDRGRIALLPADGDGVRLRLECARCGPMQPDSGHLFEGAAGRHLLRRSLAFHNFSGGSETTIRRALDLVERHDSPDDFVLALSSRRPALGTLDSTGALALEVALNADLERQMLQMRLADLEARWREEENLAGIADSLLS